MITKRRLMTAFAVGLLAMGAVGHANWWPFSKDNDETLSGDLTELEWKDLVPEDFIQPENPFATMTQPEIDKLLDGSDESNAELERLQKEFNYAPVVEKLDGLRVKIPAYITPLDFDGNTRMKEFLLVPYSAETIELTSIYDPVWAVGTIRTETVNSQLAESGYKLEVEKVMPYQAPEN